MPDLARILRDQAEAARTLAGLPAGHKDVRGVKLWLSDLTAEEVLIRLDARMPRREAETGAGAIEAGGVGVTAMRTRKTR